MPSKKPVLAQAFVDLGNATLNLYYRRVDESDYWERLEFASVVSTDELVVTHPDRITVNSTNYLVGEVAASIHCDKTGATDSGKVANALPLVIHGLSQAFGIEAPLHVAIVYTCPSIKAYGKDITKQLVGEHTITLPGDDFAMLESQTQTINIHVAKAQLEGYQAYRLVKKDCPNGAVLIDLGSRTAIATVVDAKGRIISRNPKDECGCHNIIDRIHKAECLVGFDGLESRLPDAGQIMAFLLSEQKTSIRKKQIQAITPHIMAGVQDQISFAQQYDDKPIYLLGGGALLPGIADIFSNGHQTAAVMPDPTWANLMGLSMVADKIFK